jgi:signal transduction histidine kinase
LSRAAESGAVVRDPLVSPLLLEHHSQGQLLWMSDQASCGLANLEGELLRQYFRLQKAERSLASGAAAQAIAHSRGRGAGINAQRQVELERQRLGRELHTGIGQMLAAITLQLEVIEQHLVDSPVPVRQALDRLSVLSRQVIEHVRALSRRLHPPEWQRLGLEDAVRQLWDLSGIPQGFRASLLIDPLPQQPDLPIKVLVYRAAQEALSNLIRHSKANRVDAVLGSRDGRLILMIEDDGIGFDVAALQSARANVASGIGLRSIREQAESLGATVEMESGSKGTKLMLSAPFIAEEA